MSLWSSLLETYDVIKKSSAKKQSGGNNEDDVKGILLPPFHGTLKTRLHVLLGEEGNLEDIILDGNKDAVTIIAPCTLEAMARSGIRPKPYALCDQLQHLDCDYKADLFKDYISQLSDWKADNVKLNAVYRYLSKHSLIADAHKRGLFSGRFLGSEEESDQEADKKLGTIGVRFSVNVTNEIESKVWEDDVIRHLWIEYVQSQQNSIIAGNDMMGCPVHSLTYSFPKDLANAKLISAKDDGQFKYHGRFADVQEALRLDANTIQNVHVAFQWLMANNGSRIDEQIAVVWAAGSKRKPVAPYGNSFSLEKEFEAQTDAEIVKQAQIDTDMNYAQKFSRIIRGYGNPSVLRGQDRTIAIAFFEAATDGRLSVVFYQELKENEYLECIEKWHEDASWWLSWNPQDEIESRMNTKKNKVIEFIGAPSFRGIVETIYGSLPLKADERKRVESSKAYKALTKMVKKQLVECMFTDRIFPRSWALKAFRNVTNPNGYEDLEQWNRDFGVACSIWKSIYIRASQRREDLKVELEPERDDRDYLFGRLFAYAEHLEETALKKRKISRSTNALKLMQSYVAQPAKTWLELNKLLVPYRESCKGMDSFQDMVDGVMPHFRPGEFESKEPLSPLFLLGYSAQRSALKMQTKRDSGNTHIDNEKEV